MGLFDAIDIAGSGLSAERLRMDVVAGNLANAQTTQGPNGQPYRRREVILQEATPEGASFGAALSGAMAGASRTGAGGNGVNGVEVAGVVEDQDPLRRVYDPGHPDADAQGYVSLPNVNPVTEMVDLISASRAYEANVTAMQTAKTLFTKTLELLR